MKKYTIKLFGWLRCPKCGSSNVENPYDYSYCLDCGANN